MDRAAPADAGPSAGAAPRGIVALAAEMTGRIPDLAAVSFGVWLVAFFVSVMTVGFVSAAIWGTEMEFPAAWGRPIGLQVDRFVDWMKINMDWLFDGSSNAVLQLLVWIEDFLVWMPWPATVLAVCLLSWRASGLALAAFSGAALLAIGFMGRLPDNPDSLWGASMETLALIIVSVLISLVMGIPAGILGAQSRWVDNISRPLLDGAQTMPSFVYLVPALLFFGLGTVPAVVATVIYAVPPVIRLTNLGLRQVAPETVEAARSFGATPMQLLVKVQFPMATPTIMAGVNQTTMLALSMVVIASLVGAGGLGETVLRALGRQESGNALIGGLAIITLAIITDRITQALGKAREEALAG